MREENHDGVYLICEKDAAKLLGFTPCFLQARRLRGGGPPFVRISQRAVRYRVSDLKRWAEARIVRNTSESDRNFRVKATQLSFELDRSEGC